MSDEYQALPKYEPPKTQGVRVASQEEQKPLMKMLGKMLAPKLTRMMKGKISPQSVKVGHKKKQEQVKYW